jgi:enoyl-[acyl-carrier-protein] reductase (NADH)
MTVEIPRPLLKGAKALVAGIANDQSIAYGCARAFRELGAELALTYLNEKTRTYVEPLAHALATPISRAKRSTSMVASTSWRDEGLRCAEQRRASR